MKSAKQVLIDAKLQDTRWGKRIIAAEERGEFTKHDLRNATNWVTCACGEATADIPRDLRHKPKDDELMHLGMLFPGTVLRNEPVAAASLLVRIEHRAIQVARSQK